jgi:predicted aspartyl protease
MALEISGRLGQVHAVMLCALLAVAAGAHAGETAGVGPDATSGTRLEEIAVQPPEPQFVAPTSRDRIGRIWAPVLIDGKGPFRLVLDTGANGSAVTTAAAQRISQSPQSAATVRVTGFTGAAQVPVLQVGRLEIGDFVLGPAQLPVLAEVFGGADGVLSLSGLKHERIVADFAHDRLEITRSRRQRPPYGFEVVQLRMVDGLPMARVRVGNVVTRAIIDTGAQRSVGNLALRDALARGAMRAGTREKIVGVTLDVQDADRLPTPDIQVGRVMIQGLNVAFGDMYVFDQWQLAHEPALAIGMDLLGSFDMLIIDYARGEMQVRLRESMR